MGKHDFFKKKVAFDDKRYAHFDVAAKVATLEVEGFGAGLRYDDVRQVFEAQKNFSDKSQVAVRIKSALEFLAASVPDKCAAFRSRSLTQSFISLICQLQEKDALKGKEATIAAFAKAFVDELGAQVEKGQAATDTDLIAFQKSINANVKSGPVVRDQVLLRKLFQFDPSFLTSADPSAIAAADFSGEIASVAKKVRSLVLDINNVHAAINGSDLFKATSKTAEAQAAIGEAIGSFAQYKDFVENLYFLFWEGPGSKLADKPGSFKDANTLRTELQHDVDHGKSSAIAKKKMAHGDTFKKYSGVTSPVVAAPSQFPLLQLGLLKALQNDLADLLASQGE